MTDKRLAAFLSIILLTSGLDAYEITLQGGPRMDIPEAWEFSGSDPAVPTWYSPDARGAAEVMLWAPDTWSDLQAFADEVRPDGAEGSIVAFPCWGGEAALADWTFSVSGHVFRGWFLLTRGDGPDVRVAAIAAEEDFSERQSFLLSIIDSYVPSESWRLSPGAVSRFLELSGEMGTTVATGMFEGRKISWEESPAGNLAAQDVIEREAIVLSAYAGVPELFYPAWERYYRLIYRDSYKRLDSLAAALAEGPLPPSSGDSRHIAERLLAWLQGFRFGSIEGVSDLLSPSVACSTATGDCDSLSLALLILMDRYGVDGRLLLSHKAHHALTGLDIGGEGLRYTDEDGSWLVAELTSSMPLGTLPERLYGIDDWYGIDLHIER